MGFHRDEVGLVAFLAALEGWWVPSVWQAKVQDSKDQWKF